MYRNKYMKCPELNFGFLYQKYLIFSKNACLSVILTLTGAPLCVYLYVLCLLSDPLHLCTETVQ